MWTTTERDAWLGDARDTMTDDQLDALDEACAQVEALYPDPDSADDAEQALAGALMVILGDDTLEGLGAERTRTAVEAAAAHARLLGGIAAARIVAEAAGGRAVAVDVAARAGVSRLTVARVWKAE